MKWSSLAPALFLCLLAPSNGSAKDAEPNQWSGWMEAERVYSATVVFQNEMWWPQGLIIPFHHGVHIDWENIPSFPSIPSKPGAGRSMKWTWKVLSKQVAKVHGRREWRTTFSCRILRAEEDAP